MWGLWFIILISFRVAREEIEKNFQFVLFIIPLF